MLTIGFAAMTDAFDYDYTIGILDRVNNSVIACPDSEKIVGPDQFSTTLRTRFADKRIYRSHCSPLHRCVEPTQILFC
jgi:hypothetical protein